MTAPRVLVTDIERPCFEHKYACKDGGYASVRRPPDRTKKVLLHRWVFKEIHGYYPEVVMHTCDNRRCIEPSHLKAGTWDENNKDRARKGRSAKRVPSRRKLTDRQAQEIRERFAQRRPGKDYVNGVKALSREFGVDMNVIYQISSGRTYL